HTIGPGMVLVEIQQSSDTTYRMYDYGRPRQLHLEEGLAATKERTRAGKVTPTKDKPEVLISAPWFLVEKISTHQTRQLWGKRLVGGGGVWGGGCGAPRRGPPGGLGGGRGRCCPRLTRRLLRPR